MALKRSLEEKKKKKIVPIDPIDPGSGQADGSTSESPAKKGPSLGAARRNSSYSRDWSPISFETKKGCNYSRVKTFR